MSWVAATNTATSRLEQNCVLVKWSAVRSGEMSPSSNPEDMTGRRLIPDSLEDDMFDWLCAGPHLDTGREGETVHTLRERREVAHQHPASSGQRRHVGAQLTAAAPPMFAQLTLAAPLICALLTPAASLMYVHRAKPARL